MDELAPSTILPIASGLLSLEIASLAWMIREENRVAQRGNLSWFPIADFLNLFAIASTVAVFIGPLSGHEVTPSTKLLGLSLILFFGHMLSVIGHYELFIPRGRSYRYFPPQEIVCVLLTLSTAGSYIYFVIINDSPALQALLRQIL